MGTILLDFSGKIAYIRITFKMRRGVARKERLEEKMTQGQLTAKKDQFQIWKKKVDKALVAKCGMSSEELMDCDYRGYFESDMTPDDTVTEVLIENDAPYLYSRGVDIMGESDWIAAGCDSPEEFEEALKCPIVQRPDQLWSPDEIAECFTGVNTPLDTEPGGLYEALWIVAIAIEKGTVDPGNWFNELSDSDQKKTKIVGVIRKNETDQLFADMEARRGTDKGE